MATERQAAVRIVPEPDEEGGSSKGLAYDPSQVRLSRLLTDPVSGAILSLWRDRQHHGRITYDSMYGHPAISTPLELRLSFMRANMPHYRPRASKPSFRQREMADLANLVVRLLDHSTVIDGPIRNGFHYGFSLTELSTRSAPWRNGKNFILPREIYLLPQASLDNGFIPRQEFGELAIESDPRYRCFDFDERGRIKAIHQFRHSLGTPSRDTVTWTGSEMRNIIHFKHLGGDGNPFGQSALHNAYGPWASLYLLEKEEEVFLDTALPIPFFTYKTPDGSPSPALHDKIVDLLNKQELSAARRTVVLPNADAKSVAPSNDNFTKHADLKKKELRRYAWQTLLVPEEMVSASEEGESDVRNLVQIYFKYLLKADLEEVSKFYDAVVQRILEANYGDLELDDVPQIRWSVVLDNDLRVAQNILIQTLRYLDADKIGEVYQTIFPWWEPEWFPATHADSVDAKRPIRDSNDEPNSGGAGTNDPPTKEPGSIRQRDDGQTDTPSVSIDTEA